MTIKTPKQRELAQIHIAISQLGIEDETYRQLLHGMFGVDSSSKLNTKQRGELIANLKRKGFKPKTAQGTPVRTSDDPQIKMIRGLWLELHDLGKVYNRDEAALQRWVQRQTKVARLEWLNGKQINTVIESLKEWRDRPQAVILPAKKEVKNA